MNNYSAPTRDMRFVLNELAGLSELNQLPGLEEATVDTVDAVLDEAARFAAAVLAPLNRTGDVAGASCEDARVMPPAGFRDAYRAFTEGGWGSLPFAPEYGGQGLPELVAAATNEIWQSANMAFALCPMLTEGCAVALGIHGSPALKNMFLPKLVSGEWAGTMNLTEPQAGSDLAELKTRAVPNGDSYLISGRKIFITWGDHDFTDNIVHMVLARLPEAPPGVKGISLFLVPKYLVNADGSGGRRNDVRPVSVEHKLGIHGSPTCVMSYGDNGGAHGYLVGTKHDGMACMFTMMNHARLAVGIQGLSIAERAYQQALGYAREREQGKIRGQSGRARIIQHADVRRMLMLMKSGCEAMRALAYVAAAALDHIHHSAQPARHTERFALLTPVVKAWCTELAQELTSLGVQVHGGMGYIEETGAAQHFRDARITSIYEGTNGIQAQDLVGRKVLRDQGKALRELIAEIRQTAADLSATEVNQAVIKRALGDAVEQLAQATDWLLANAQRDPNAPGAVALNFLMLTGYVCGGWQLARAAMIAAAKAAATNDGFYQSKIITARFYAEHYLPRSAGHFSAIRAGSESMMALGEEQF
ncbi:MAG: acyl-CoA dehydrogenase C-terminal domain-containing protein [Gammaproteobacteria bacterium]|nr:acyl-CoA dehydrogenase C-terminal domain-containing protein [Gammaproteobacteria bacterium]